MQPTDIRHPDTFHRVVDCQWACPAHTPVPEYIRLIAAGRYDDAYMLNWWSNVFPGILGRTCDRPCEPACRRGRVEENNGGHPEPVAICRLKRVAADNKGEVRSRMPRPAAQWNGRRIACVGAGPSALTVARDLAPLGYRVTIFEAEAKAGGFMRTQVPRFRLPEEVIDEETGYILDLGVDFVAGRRIGSMRALLAEGYDAIFVGSGAPRGRDLDLPGRQEAAGQIHVGLDWLANVYFGHVTQVGKRVLVLGGGNTAMDCCRSARRLGGSDVKVLVRSGFDEMKASPWEKEDAMHEGIPILDCRVPKSFVHASGRLTGMTFGKVRVEYDDNGRRQLVPTGEPDEFHACDEVLIAVGQENAFPWIERDIGIEFDPWGLPVVDAVTHQSTLPHVLFGGDAAFGPKNIIWAVAHGHAAAISIDLLLQGRDPAQRPPPETLLASQKMGIHEWRYDNAVSPDERYAVPWSEAARKLDSMHVEVELGFDPATAWAETQRCLNCDVQTVFTDSKCIECDACVDICPTDCITFTANGEEEDVRQRLTAPALNTAQPLYVSGPLKTQRVMVKDEDVCLHCGLCAERCPTGAWDMQKFLLQEAHAGGCRSKRKEAA
ncbi:FAD-dependent oxidoreductase [Pseudofulvimonas gallinarii]|uniref:NADPH-dependent glutamate synthase beta subunit-like oxidoreductase n=1 Tax=Pseudofulvimonas gallinarii TaxID=634155 RepID=A0A4S3KVN9_9GAMM|nr:FAD-dependent oxidoreductase [Pseudofulvimonas gallinarii]TCS96017.1 NADPH-dependent glutamate synthase beta subunit-like oxidoreductase [Pseudofulvimonas gallinarii]THD13312.1 glutamate synthase [Pseudofulvimonas gallinarii]